MRIRLLTSSLFLLLATLVASAGNLYFVNTPGWTAPYAYCWNPINTAFPGLPMTQIGTTSQGNEVWSYAYAAQSNVIFSNNGNNQTSDLTILADQAYNLQRDTWYSPENLYIQGTMTAWENRADNKFSEWDPSSNTTIVTWSKVLTANTTYDFKITYFDGTNTWYRSDGGTMTVANHGNTGWWFMGAGGNTQIQTTRAGTYTFKYDWAENLLYVEWPESECTGSGLRHFNGIDGAPIEYKVEYADGKIIFTAWAIDPSKTLDFLEVQWWNSSVGRQNFTGTAAGGIGTYTLDLSSYPLLTPGAEIYFRFHYGIAELGGRYLTSDEPVANTNPQTCYIRVGDCIAETNPPCMTSASLATNGSTSVVLNVSATDDSGTPTRFIVTEANSLVPQQTLNSVAGQITIDGLTSCTDYTFRVVARDGSGNISSDNSEPDCQYKEVSLTTLAETGNMATTGTASASYLPGNIGEYPEMAIDGNPTTSAYTSYGRDLPISWQVDLGTLQYVQRVRIYWGDAYAADYEIQLSQDDITYTTVYHQTSAPAHSGGTGVYQDHDFSPLAARYVRIQTNTNNWVRIYEVEVYGSGECYATMDAPTMVSASLASATTTTATLSVSGTDALGNPTNLFVVNGTTYIASAGQIVVEGLTPCTQYNLTVYTLDRNGVSSSTNIVPANQSKIVTLTTASASALTNLALGKPATSGYEGNVYQQAAKAVDGEGVINGNAQTRWGTEGRPSIDNDWIQIDLEAAYYIDHIKIQWELARPIQYQLLLSLDGTNWRTWQYNTAPAYDDANNHVYVTYGMSGIAARYVKMKSLANYSGYGVSIWEVEVYGTGECYVPNDNAPVMLTATEYSRSSTETVIAVTASDDTTDPVVTYIIDGLVHTATDGKLTMPYLSPCQRYSWRIYAMDENENISANYIDVNLQADAPAAGTNIALQHPVYSGFDQGGFPKEAAIDGDRTTRWATTGRPTSNDEWLVIDLEGTYKINRIEVEWEYGTSINYEFKNAYVASFGPNVIGGNTFDQLITGHFATFDHRNEQPEGSKPENFSTNEKNSPNADHVVDTYDYTSEQIYGRYIKLESGLRAEYATSLWEIRVYGECAEEQHIPVMQWAETVSLSSDVAEIYVSALDYETSETNMRYKVYVTGGESGYKQLTSEYIFTPSQFAGGRTGHLDIGGLIPGVPYEARIYAIDEDDNQSENYKVLYFTTVSAEGCVFSGTEAYRAGAAIGNASTQIFQKGYRVTVTGDENSFTIVAYTDDDFYELDPLIVQLLLNPADPANSGIVERTMTAVAGQDRTYTYTFNRGDNAIAATRDWTGEVTFFIKYPFRASGICLTYPITYDIDNGCAAAFIIFHHDDKPTADAQINYAGGTIDRDIRYYRNFNAGIWEDLTMPFEVDSILVYDPEDHRYYKLTAQYNNGSTVRGKFLLRKQVDNVSGEDFVPSWYDGNTPLPQLNQPYAIRFTSSYYADKYVLFCGHKNQTIASDFTKGGNPVAVDQYMLYGNPTMMPQSVGTAYLLPADHSDETYRRATGAYVRPFETYVLASETTTSIMPIIAPWRGTPLVTTDITDAEEVMLVRPYIEVFSVMGQRIGFWQNATILDVQEECRAHLPLGCYVLSTTGATLKMIVR